MYNQNYSHPMTPIAALKTRLIFFLTGNNNIVSLLFIEWLFNDGHLFFNLKRNNINNMAKDLLEGEILKPVSLSLNPKDLKRFDELVGIDQRSKTVRKLIRNYIKAPSCIEDISSSTGRA